MRPHPLWFLPVVLTLHCAEGSSFDKGGGVGGAGAETSGSGGKGGEATGGTGGASSSSGAMSSSSSSSSGSAGSGGAKDPCEGISCTTPPANVCKDSSYLTVKESPGTCAEGNCVYAEHDEWCAYGCSMGACNADPCTGVTCNMPPTNYCSGPNTRVVYASPGTCDKGTCSYTMSSENCEFGCVMGFCEGDPCIGVSCNMPPANSCADANTKVVYPATGTCSGGTCSYMPMNVNCPAGCMNGACIECSTNANCPAGEWCNQMQCDPCNTSAHCGASCGACGGATPHCLNGSMCVQCVTANDCPTGQQCGPGNTCVAGCTPPASACTSAGSVDGGCANPRVISRTAAGSASGYAQSAYGMCGRGANFASGGCGGAGADAEYRLFMRAGESVQTTVTKYGYCNQFAFGNLTLKVFQAACDAACGCPVPTACPSSTSRVVCQVGSGGIGSSFTNNYTADKDGWYTFVVDTENTGDDNYQFTMTLKLTCSGTCGC